MRKEVYLFAIVSSLLLSFWITAQQNVLNADAVCYLLSAEHLSQASIKSAMQLCGQAKWPFYSVLIHAVATGLHLSYQTAAYLLNGSLTLLSVLVFIRIVKELGGSNRVLWLSAFVILLSHEFNSVREYIIRDHGFWAFYLSSILCLLCFFREGRWLWALGFSASLFIATLFRIEGAVFLLIAPFLSWCLFKLPLKTRFAYFLKLNAIPLVLLTMLIGWLVLHPNESMAQLGRVAEVPHQIVNGFKLMGERFVLTKAGLSQHVLSMESANEAGFVLVLVIAVWYLLAVIHNISLPYACLVAIAWLRRVHPLTSAAFVVLVGYVLINLAITLGFLAERLFLSKRYLIALSLVLMLWVPFALDYLISQWAKQRSRIALLVLTFLIAFSSVGGIFEFGHSKAYILQAGNWLSQHIPASASFYTNDYLLMYYSHHFGNDIFVTQQNYTPITKIAEGKWKQYDYLALRLGKSESAATRAILREINFLPIQEFSNKHGDRVVIFKVALGEKH